MLHQERLSVRVFFFFFFDILHHFAIQLLCPPILPLLHYPPQNHSCYALIITQRHFLLLKECSKKALGGFMRNP